MCEVWSIGEVLVEIMRTRPDSQLYENGEFAGPFPSGAPAIFIDTVSRLGHSAGMIGGVASDDFGKCILDRLNSDDVDCEYIAQIPDSVTAVAFVTYFTDGSRKFIFHIDKSAAVKIRKPDLQKIKGARYLHIMGCSLMVNDQFYNDIIDIASMFAENGTRISFDPNIRPELLRKGSIFEVVDPILKNCSVLLPGSDEILLITNEKDEISAVKKLFLNNKLEFIVVKKGKKGSTIYSRTESFDFGIYDIDPIDPTGAGDSFDAGFLCGLLEKKSLLECAEIATAAASLNTAAFGPMEGDISVETVNKLIKK